MKTPTVGQPFEWDRQTLIPTYVRESERPTARGECLTADYCTDRPIVAAGWYVEWHYVDDHIGYRSFIPFGGE